ncbi:hypothetical protein TNCV_1054321 [Trichonephila clavipes]|nr:hypothetical protein TNCV_1054321 [Trichonephila clavipes]
MMDLMSCLRTDRPASRNFTCRNCGGGDRGRVAIYRPFGEFHRAYIALSPVWCSRPTTGVPLAHATMNFVGLVLTTSDSTADEAWLYNYDPTIKQQSSEWKHPSSPTPKKAKTVKLAGITPSASKKRITVLLSSLVVIDNEAVLLDSKDYKRRRVTRCIEMLLTTPHSALGTNTVAKPWGANVHFALSPRDYLENNTVNLI